MNSHYPQVAARASWRCEYCRAPEKVFNKEFEVDHIIPRAHGGEDAMDNFALACHSCNKYKGPSIEELDLETGQMSRLFNPRTDNRDMHFSLNSDTGEIAGSTSVGRVTITRLKINGNIQLKARRKWMSYGAY
jgi:hypothetical protein